MDLPSEFRNTNNIPYGFLSVHDKYNLDYHQTNGCKIQVLTFEGNWFTTKSFRNVSDVYRVAPPILPDTTVQKFIKRMKAKKIKLKRFTQEVMFRINASYSVIVYGYYDE